MWYYIVFLVFLLTTFEEKRYTGDTSLKQNHAPNLEMNNNNDLSDSSVRIFKSTIEPENNLESVC